MNLKQNLFVDFDSTLANSIQAYCGAYTDLWGAHPDYKKPNPDNVKLYNLKDECPLESDPPRVFTLVEFWKHCRFMGYAKEIILELNEKYNITICSIGRPKNIAFKSLWLNDNLPEIQSYILINNGTCKMDKSIVRMEGGILIDDHAGNLETSTADRKICFGKTFDWNKEWKGERAENWLRVREMLL